MEVKPEDLPRLRVLSALRKFSLAVQSDVLADGGIAARFNIPVSKPARLSDQVSVDRNLLFTALQKVVDGLPLPEFVDEHGKPLQLGITIEADAGIVAHQDQRWVFANAALLSSDPLRRAAVLTRCLSRNTVRSEDRARLENLVAKEDFAHGDFVAAAAILGASPESFAAVLRQKTASGPLTMRDLLPEQPAHWSNLTAPRIRSASLEEFIAGELAAERSAQIERNPAHALAAIALTFASPLLIPHDLFKDVPADVMLEGVERVAVAEGPFALCGALDLCAERAGGDGRFATAGEKILDKLFADMDLLAAACDLFGAVFVLATAYLAEHETFRRQPVFWRRLAAASHAALVVRTLGVAKPEGEPLLTWVSRVRGNAYLLSVFNEFCEEPRWRPDWIAPRFLTADVVGRSLISSQRLPEGQLPAGWQERLTAARSYLDMEKLQFAAHLPAVLEGARRPRNPTLQDLAPITEAYQRLIDEPAPDLLLGMTPAIRGLGFPVEAADAAIKVIGKLRSDPGNLQDEIVQATMSLAADIAADICDVGLADLVADASIESFVSSKAQKSVAELVFRLLVCAGANRDREEAMTMVARRFEHLAFLLPPATLPNFMNLLRTLQVLDNRLALHLGRALAIARSGRPRTSAT
jgi:hypothetical protein